MLTIREQQRRVLLGALQPHLLQRHRWRALQGAGDRVGALLHLALAGGEAGHHRAGQLRNYVPGERVHLLRQAAHRRMRVGVAEAHDAQLRLAVRELLQGARQLLRALDSADHGELIHGHSPIPRARQDLLDRLAVVRQRGSGHLQIHIPRERRVCGRAAAVGALGRALRRTNRVAHAELRQRAFRGAQAGLGAIPLLLQNRRQLGESFALQIRRHDHEPVRDGIDGRRDEVGVVPASLEADEVAIGCRSDPQRVGEHDRRLTQRNQLKPQHRSRAQGTRRRHPGETQHRTYGVARAPLLQNHVRIHIPQREGAPRRVHLEPVRTRPDLAGDGQRRPGRGIRRRFQREVQPRLADDIVQDDPGSDQVEPAARGTQQLGALNRTLIAPSAVPGALRCLDPDCGARLIDGLEKPRRAEARRRADDRHGTDQEPVAARRGEDPPPIARRRDGCARGPRSVGREGQSQRGGCLLRMRGGVACHAVGPSLGVGWPCDGLQAGYRGDFRRRAV